MRTRKKVKAKAVVHPAKFRKKRLPRFVFTSYPAGPIQEPAKVLLNFRFRISRQTPVLRPKRNIGNRVESRKNAGILNLRNPGHKEEPEAPFGTLYHRVKTAQGIPNLIKECWIGQTQRQRRIVLIDKHHERRRRPRFHPFAQLHQEVGIRPFSLKSEPTHHLQQHIFKEVLELCFGFEFIDGGKVQRHHIVGFVLPQRLDGEALKVLQTVPKKGFKRRNQQRLTETARAGEKEFLALHGQLVNLRRFIHVDFPLLPQRMKGGSSYGQFFRQYFIHIPPQRISATVFVRPFRII